MNDGSDTDWVTRSGEGNTIVDDNTTWATGSTSLSYNTGPSAITLRSLTARTGSALPWAGAAVAVGGLGALAAYRRRR